MRPPCEVIVKNVLPAMRASVVRHLREKHNMKQKDIASRVGITQAAVSQYMSETRGRHGDVIKEFPVIEKTGKGLADEIAKNGGVDTSILIEGFCCLCKSLRNDKRFCELHGLPLEPGGDCRKSP
jgi:predicted transcriptional regulator